MSAHRITNSYTPKIAYREIRKNKYKEIGYKITEKQYLDIIREVDLLMAREFLKGNVVKLPNKMGNIELRKKQTSVFIDKEGKIKTNKVIDWVSTRKLWAEDKECLKSKILVHKENDMKPVVIYNKKRAIFKNKGLCKFRINRKILQKAHIIIENNECLIFSVEQNG